MGAYDGVSKAAMTETRRMLDTLRRLIRERGRTHRDVQKRFAWGESYVSQLLTLQKELRVAQVLMILEAIGVEPADFFAELYSYSIPSAGGLVGQIERQRERLEDHEGRLESLEDAVRKLRPPGIEGGK